MESIFRSIFEERLNASLDNFTPPGASVKYPVRSLIPSVWRSFSGLGDPEGFAACDGSSGSAHYSGGLTVWLLRAACISSYRKEPLVDVWVEPGHKLKGRGYALRALELRLLADAAEGLPRGSLVITDGTLYPTLPPSVERLLLRAKYVKAFLESLVRLLKICVKRRLNVVGVSKDSDVSYLRVRLALDYLARHGVDIGRERSLRRIARKLRGFPGNSAAQLVAEELEIPTSDQEEVHSATSTPGFTTPLVLAPHILYMTEEINVGTKSWWRSRLRDRWSGNEELKPIVDLLDELYELKPVYVTYWRPHHGFGVYRVDSVAEFHEGRWGDMEVDVLSRAGEEHVEMVVSLLNGLSPAPHTVRPLLDADELVRLRSGVFRDSYEPMIRAALEARGFYPRPRMRILRDLYLRRL